MDLNDGLSWAGARHDGVLITLRGDGRPQSSDITYLLVDGVFWVSLTDGRAKTKNMRRDARVVMHITDRASWSYLSFDCTAELTDVAADPADSVADQLVDYFRAVSGEHSDWDEYRAAMVTDGRLIAKVTPHRVVGQLN